MNGNMLNKSVCMVIFLCLCFSCLDVFAAKKKYKKVPGGIDALIEVSRSQKEMQSLLDTETKNYKKVKKAIESNQIKPGDQALQLSDRYGEPVVKLDNKIARTEKWVYKPGNKDFFSNEQIWLIFDKKGALLFIKYPSGTKTDQHPE